MIMCNIRDKGKILAEESMLTELRYQ
jgi:hypothetical protein